MINRINGSKLSTLDDSFSPRSLRIRIPIIETSSKISSLLNARRKCFELTNNAFDSNSNEALKKWQWLAIHIVAQM